MDTKHEHDERPYFQQQEGMMRSLNCRVGDIAITVKCEVKANLGKMVRIIGEHGLDDWSDFDKPLFLWEIESIGNRRLRYDLPNGKVSYRRKGLAPDIFLRPIRNPGELEGIASVEELEISI